MNFSILKDSLGLLFDSPAKRTIAILLIVIGGFTINMLINISADEVKSEIEVVEETLQEEAVEYAKAMEIIKNQDEQIRALWLRLNKIDSELWIEVRRINQDYKEHITKKRH